MGVLHPNFIAGIGGSAGGLNAYTALLDALSPKTGMAFVVISHMNPSAHSYLAQILSRHTKMPVRVASNAMRIHANHVYVIPPNSDIFIENYAFKIISPRAIRGKQVDCFLISLAEAMGARAIGIILSGYRDDGTEGCKAIKAKGGITFAQDESAEINEMSLSAQESGCIDFVLSPEKIPAALKRLVSNSKKRII